MAKKKKSKSIRDLLMDAFDGESVEKQNKDRIDAKLEVAVGTPKPKKKKKKAPANDTRWMDEIYNRARAARGE